MLEGVTVEAIYFVDVLESAEHTLYLRCFEASFVIVLLNKHAASKLPKHCTIFHS